MADTFYAATKIKYGVREGDSPDGKYEQKVFEPGDKVTGLPVDDMRGLWNAGALTREAPESTEEPKDEEPKDTGKTPTTPASTSTSTSTSKTSTASKPASGSGGASK